MVGRGPGCDLAPMWSALGMNEYNLLLFVNEYKQQTLPGSSTAHGEGGAFATDNLFFLFVVPVTLIVAPPLSLVGARLLY